MARSRIPDKAPIERTKGPARRFEERRHALRKGQFIHVRQAGAAAKLSYSKRALLISMRDIEVLLITQDRQLGARMVTRWAGHYRIGLHVVGDVEGAARILSHRSPNVLLVDLDWGGDFVLDGLRKRQLVGDIPVVVMDDPVLNRMTSSHGLSRATAVGPRPMGVSSSAALAQLLIFVVSGQLVVTSLPEHGVLAAAG